MNVKIPVIVEVELEGNWGNPRAEALRILDEFREAVQPSAEYGITIYRSIPRVLVEVYGGVADFRTSGNCDVKLVDYDNHDKEYEQEKAEADAWLEGGAE